MFGAPFYVDMPFSGGVVGACGGDVPRMDTATDYCDDDSHDDPVIVVANPGAVAAGRRVYVARNRDDDFVEAIDAGADYWEAAGATVRRVDTGSGGHCAFDVTGALVEGLEYVDTR